MATPTQTMNLHQKDIVDLSLSPPHASNTPSRRNKRLRVQWNEHTNIQQYNPTQASTLLFAPSPTFAPAPLLTSKNPFTTPNPFSQHQHTTHSNLQKNNRGGKHRGRGRGY